MTAPYAPDERAQRRASEAMLARGKPQRCTCPDDGGACEWCLAYYTALQDIDDQERQQPPEEGDD